MAAERTGPSPGAEADDSFGVGFVIEDGDPLVGRRDLVIELAEHSDLRSDVVGQFAEVDAPA